MRPATKRQPIFLSLDRTFFYLTSPVATPLRRASRLPQSRTVLPVQTPTPTVYVAGWESSGAKMVTKLWKNGAAQSLSDGANDAYAFSVFVK